MRPSSHFPGVTQLRISHMPGVLPAPFASSPPGEPGCGGRRCTTEERSAKECVWCYYSCCCCHHRPNKEHAGPATTFHPHSRLQGSSPPLATQFHSNTTNTTPARLYPRPGLGWRALGKLEATPPPRSCLQHTTLGALPLRSDLDSLSTAKSSPFSSKDHLHLHHSIRIHHTGMRSRPCTL